MALLWVEPFDQYGGNNASYTSGAFGYTDTAISGWVTGRTGNYGLQLFNAQYLRRALDNPVSTLGSGAAIQPQTGAGNAASTSQGFHFESAGKTLEVAFVELPDNSIGVYDRTGTQVGKTPANSMIVGSWQWVECKAIGNTGGANTGTAIVKINGVTKCTVNGINLPNQFAFISIGGSTGFNMYWDDWIVWDNSGTQNNDFMGDRRLICNFPNANGATQNFTPSAGNAWQCVNLTPPVDTTYIQSATPGDVSEFTKTALGIASNSIAAAVVIGRLFKTDAGTASGRVGINSNGIVSNSAEMFPGTTGAWFRLIQELDPNGNIAWTQAAYDAANIRVTRVQ